MRKDGSMGVLGTLGLLPILINPSADNTKTIFIHFQTNVIFNYCSIYENSDLHKETKPIANSSIIVPVECCLKVIRLADTMVF